MSNQFWSQGLLLSGTCLDDMTLQWRHNGGESVSNHQPRACLLNRLCRRRSKKKSKLRVTGLCAGNSPVTGEFPAQMAGNAEKLPFDEVIMRYVDFIVETPCVSHFLVEVVLLRTKESSSQIVTYCQIDCIKYNLKCSLLCEALPWQ